MGYVPDWARAHQGKKPAASVAKTETKFGIVSKPLFHGAVQKFADGGEVELNVNGDKVGEYSGNDEIVKYRMNQIDAEGNDLRIPKSANTTQAQMEAQDMEGSSAKDPTPAKAESPAAAPARVNASKSSASKATVSKPATPQSQYDAQDMENGPGNAPAAKPSAGTTALSSVPKRSKAEVDVMFRDAERGGKTGKKYLQDALDNSEFELATAMRARKALRK